MDNYGQYNNQPPSPMFFQPNMVPGREEKRKIRHNYNVIGITLLALYILLNGAAIVLFSIFSPNVVYNEDGAVVENFRDTLIGGCVPAASAILVFIFYCVFSRYRPGELFRAEGLNKGQIFRYVLIVLGLQQVSIICSMIMSNLFYSMGLEVYTTNYVLEHRPSVYAVDIFSTVILAPIGEELIYRGVVLRCAAKVSQRFAIFFSAFIFGIMHGNPYQFLLGFLLGIPMAIITIKTGSLIPTIICHMSVNFMASVYEAVEYFDEEASTALSFIMLPILLILGIIMLASEVVSGRMKLPEYTDFHRSRTFPVLITSWSMIIIMVLYVYELITSVRPIQETPEAPEIVGESVRLFIERIFL